MHSSRVKTVEILERRMPLRNHIVLGDIGRRRQPLEVERFSVTELTELLALGTAGPAPRANRSVKRQFGCARSYFVQGT